MRFRLYVAKKREDKSKQSTKEPFNPIFNGLAGLRDQLAQQQGQEPEKEQTVQEQQSTDGEESEEKNSTNAGEVGWKALLVRCKKIVLRREKKGRGGKTVTIVEGLSLSEDEAKSLCKAVKKGLGCGAHIEDGLLVLQGALTERAQTWFSQNGVKKVVIGN